MITAQEAKKISDSVATKNLEKVVKKAAEEGYYGVWIKPKNSAALKAVAEFVEEYGYSTFNPAYDKEKICIEWS